MMEERVITIGAGRLWRVYAAPLTEFPIGWEFGIPSGWGAILVNPSSPWPGWVTRVQLCNSLPCPVDIITITVDAGRAYVSEVWNNVIPGSLVYPAYGYIQALFIGAGEASGVTQGDTVTVMTPSILAAIQDVAAVKAKTDNLPVDPADQASAQSAVAAAQAAVIAAQIAAAKVELFNSSEMFVFPSATNIVCTLAAGGVANTFGAWAEIVDSSAVVLSDSFAANPGYLAELTAFMYSAANNSYMIEIAYGAAFDVIGRLRFYARANAVITLLIKSRQIPAGELVYYRMMCEVGGATCDVAFRYFMG